MFKFFTSTRFQSVNFLKRKISALNAHPNVAAVNVENVPLVENRLHLKKRENNHQIEEGLTFKTDHWEAQYPWIRNPNDLPNNRHSAMAMLKSTERRLLRNTTHAETYNNQIKDMVQRGVAHKLLTSEIWRQTSREHCNHGTS